jgi:hypothetical protein
MLPKRQIVAILLSIFAGSGIASVNAFALSLESLLPEAQVRQLLQTGSLDRERFDTSELNMVPRYATLERRIETLRQSIDPNITVESMRLYKKPAGAASVWTTAERNNLYNGIVAVSTLKGIEYFSKRRNAMRLLYETSSVINNPTEKTPLDDPSYDTPPAETSLCVRQKDLTFGDNVYQFIYYADESSFIVVQENITAMNYGPVPVVGRNNLKSVVAVLDCGPYLLVYAASMAKASMIPGMKQRAGESIFNRANALLLWFTGKANRAFGKSG